MANQIARFFVFQPGGHAAADIAEHLDLYWPASMRAAIVAYVENGGQGLDPAARQAIGVLRTPVSTGA